MSLAVRAASICVCLLAAVCGASRQPPDNGASGDLQELFLGVGKVLVISTASPVERLVTGFGEIAEATAISPNEVLVSGKAPGETSLIIWQKSGEKQAFDVTVTASHRNQDARLDAVRRQLRREFPGQDVTLTLENDTVFLRGTVKDLTQAERAASIAGTLAKTVNLLYVRVPAAERQILLRVRFANVDRSASTELGLNLASTGATNTVGSISTQQFAQPKIERGQNGVTTATLSDALNLFFFRPDLNLLGTIKALQRRSLLEILAEPNVLAMNGKPASFLAGGEYPYPILQGGGAGLGTVTIQFREFGVRINFIPTLTPRGTIRLEVAPEVSALDFANGLVFQGFQIPALTVRRVQTEIELAPGQSFAIGGLLDRRLTETLQKIPFLSNVPVLGKLFQSKAVTRQNSELLVIVTPEVVEPVSSDQALPSVKFPKELPGPEQAAPRTPAGGAAVPAAAPGAAMPVEKLVESLAKEESKNRKAPPAIPSSAWRPETDLPKPPLPSQR